jgi:chromosome segregation ATPase
MYHRSLAAQQQSKAGSQWAFFQFKRVRGTSLEMTAETLQSLAHPAAFDPAELDSVMDQLISTLEKVKSGGAKTPDLAVSVNRIKKARANLTELLASESGKSSLRHLLETTVPTSESLSLPNKEVQAAIDEVVKLIGDRKTEEETASKVRDLRAADIAQATQLAEENADKFDKASEPVGDTIKQLRSILAELEAAVKPVRKLPDITAPLAAILANLEDLNKGLRLAILEFDARRYRQESAYNRKAAELYEVRVRRSGIESDRHRDRSKHFFYSMLLAQLGVTIASLALAHRERKALWVFAALAGLIALGFSSYIYLTL